MKPPRATLPLIASVLAAAGAGAATLDQPTYTRDVAPILGRNCVSCHQPGEIAPVPLRTYDEVRP